MPETTSLESRYVVRSLLKTLLDQKFPNQWKVKTMGDYMEVETPRKLTKSEIDSVMLVE